MMNLTLKPRVSSKAVNNYDGWTIFTTVVCRSELIVSSLAMDIPQLNLLSTKLFLIRSEEYSINQWMCGVNTILSHRRLQSLGFKLNLPNVCNNASTVIHCCRLYRYGLHLFIVLII